MIDFWFKSYHYLKRNDTLALHLRLQTSEYFFMTPLEAYSVLIISGILIRYALIYAGQAWAKTYSQTISFLLLPVIAYIITKTIAGNIALSLGMIGALSIVRFRHPVKSALELIIYFDLITIGIATSVRTKWAIQLAVCTIVIIIAVDKTYSFIFITYWTTKSFSYSSRTRRDTSSYWLANWLSTWSLDIWFGR